MLRCSPPNFGFLLAARFFTGAAVGGTLPVDYAMMAEFLPSDRRGRWLVMLEAFWAVGTVIVALTAWAAAAAGITDAWRIIFLVTAIPALIGFWLRLIVPESPLFLLRKGRGEEARAVIDRLLMVNGKAPLSEPLAVDEMPRSVRLLSPALKKRTLLMLVVWFLVSLSYYGIFTWMPARLAGEGFGFVRGYGFLVVVALAQLPGYALAAWGVERIGRRPTLIGFLLLSAAGCVLFVIAGNATLVATAILLMSFALLGTWGALYAYTPELYPTAARASGMGAAGAVARLGGLLAPSLLSLLIARSFGAAVALFAVLLILAALAASQIDTETRQQALD